MYASQTYERVRDFLAHEIGLAYRIATDKKTLALTAILTAFAIGYEYGQENPIKQDLNEPTGLESVVDSNTSDLNLRPHF